MFSASDSQGGDPRVVVSTAAFHVRARGSFPGLAGLKETKRVSSPSTRKTQYCGGLRDREVACSSHSSHHPQEVLLA